MPSLLESARALAPLLEAEAAAGEAAGAVTPAAVDALTQAGMFALMVPEALGGPEADIVTTLEVLEELARADGSTGWALMANVTATGFAASYCGDAAVKEMWSGALPAIHCGQLAPRGVADAVESGYRIAGSFSFGSGSSHTGYVAGGFVERRDGEVVLDARGLPRIVVALVPRDRAVFKGNWDVLGLSGTASVDYDIPEQEVGVDWTYPLLEAIPQRGGPVYRLGVLSITAMGHAAYALGVGRRAMDELTGVARAKQRMGAEPIRDQQLFQHDYAVHDAAVHAARALVLDWYGQAQAVVDAGDVPDPLLAQRLRQATTYATRVAADAVRFAYVWSGSHGLRNPSALGRCFRDMYAATQHVMVDNETLTKAAQLLVADRP